MSALSLVRDLFVEPPAVAPPQTEGPPPAVASLPTPVRQPARIATLAVLGPPARVRAAAAGLGLALARRQRQPMAVVAAIGTGAVASAPAVPAAHRCAVGLRRTGASAVAAGRLVWLADPAHLADAADVARDEGDAPDEEAEAAAVGAALLRAADTAAAPAVLAVPVARCAAVDVLLARQDALVVLNDPDAPPSLAELVRASLAELGRPVAVMEPLSRAAAALATAGLHAPAAAVAALAALQLEGTVR